MNPAIDAFLNAVPALVKAIDSGDMSDKAQEEVIRAAQYYARRNGLSFDGTMRGAIKMAEKAQATLSTYVSKSRAADSGVSRDGRTLTGTGYGEFRTQ